MPFQRHQILKSNELKEQYRQLIFATILPYYIQFRRI